MSDRGLCRVGATLSVVVAMVGLAILPASGQTSAAPSASVTTPMQLDPATSVSAPDGNGNVTVALQSGRTVQVPQRYASLVAHPQPPAGKTSGGVQTSSTVYGNCGSSYINLMEKSNGAPVRMTTGFHTYDASISYSWNASIGGPGYHYPYGASGSLAYRHDWNGQHTSDNNYPRGDYFASVSSSYSYALLYWGGICSSGGPVTHAFL